MNIFISIAILFLTLTCSPIHEQYEFSGYVDTTIWTSEVSLSLSEDYRKTSGIYSEQIIQKIRPDSTGFFKFSGTTLPNDNRFYNIHIENCSKNGICYYDFH